MNLLGKAQTINGSCFEADLDRAAKQTSNAQLPEGLRTEISSRGVDRVIRRRPFPLSSLVPARVVPLADHPEM